MKRILLIVNDAGFFLSHRLPVAQEAIKNGYKVFLASKGTDSQKALIESEGITFIPIRLSRSGLSLISNLQTFHQICSAIKDVKPDLVHAVTIKPVVYGGIASRLLGVPALVCAVSGLGNVFVSKRPLSKVVRKVASLLYRLAFMHNNITVIFQNPDDRDQLINLVSLNRQRCVLIRGSGVDLKLYRHLPQPDVVKVLMVSRLLKDKGLCEFVKAAQNIRRHKPEVVFQVVGDPDPDNPASVTESELLRWKQEGNVEFLGYHSDVRPFYETSSIVCLPSYREGLPKVLIEAAASGRPVVTTDVPGCRFAVEEGITGLLAPPKHSEALANQINVLIEDRVLREKMGQAAYELAQREFSVNYVVERHLDIYQQLLGKKSAEK
ncbi:MAG: glycosyltransferase family 4 protein [Neptuniibacter sp.]